MKTPYDGGCLCRTIRYTCMVSPDVMYYRHCTDCGSQIDSDNGDDANMVSIKAGTLDDCSQFAPDTQIWVDSKVAWANLPADLKFIDAVSGTDKPCT